MERIENIRADAHDEARTFYQNGLRQVFEINHEPIPTKMARLLETLCEIENGASPRR